jgi:hypothetical protein
MPKKVNSSTPIDPIDLIHHLDHAKSTVSSLPSIILMLPAASRAFLSRRNETMVFWAQRAIDLVGAAILFAIWRGCFGLATVTLALKGTVVYG